MIFIPLCVCVYILCMSVCKGFYLPEISHRGGQRALSGDVGWVPRIVIHLRGEQRKDLRCGCLILCCDSSQISRFLLSQIRMFTHT